jgi:two-component system, chemotaxis family, chemotaxis protein CheY
MKKSILLVEDDPFLIDIYSSKFKAAGFDVTVVEDGAMVFTKTKEIMPVLVILDLVLPHIDGWGILKQLKESQETSSVPVVIFSNLSQKSDIDKASEMGAAEYMIKSQYTPSEVVEKIKKFLNL